MSSHHKDKEREKGETNQENDLQNIMSIVQNWTKRHGQQHPPPPTLLSWSLQYGIQTEISATTSFHIFIALRHVVVHRTFGTVAPLPFLSFFVPLILIRCFSAEFHRNRQKRRQKEGEGVVPLILVIEIL